MLHRQAKVLHESVGLPLSLGNVVETSIKGVGFLDMTSASAKAGQNSEARYIQGDSSPQVPSFVDINTKVAF